MKTKQHQEDDKLLAEVKASAKKVMASEPSVQRIELMMQNVGIKTTLSRMLTCRSLFELADVLRLGRSATRAALRKCSQLFDRVAVGNKGNAVGGAS